MKEHPFFKGLDWVQVYLQKYSPPLIPPKGEVNAADAFDIGSFDEEDTKGIKVGSLEHLLSFLLLSYMIVVDASLEFVSSIAISHPNM